MAEATQVNDGALNLVAQIVDRNVRDLAFTTDRIIESLEAQLLDMARTVVGMAEVLEDATVVDRRTEQRLRMYDGKVSSAYMHLERKESST